MSNENIDTAPYGAREYYSATAKPHFKWFDEAATEQAFLSTAAYRDEGWQQTGMWCCCACIADTPVAIPVGSELVKNLKRGDAVLAGNVAHDGDGLVISWSDSQVGHAGELTDASDIDPGDAKAVLINFGDGRNIIVSSYQMMMTGSGKLKQALQLSLGDSLVSKAGEPVTINEIKVGDFSGPRYHVGTDLTFDEDVDGHLVALGDVVVADYVLQKNRLALPATAVEGSVA